MPEWVAVILLIVGSFVLCFAISGVIPRRARVKKSRERSEAFLENYVAYLRGNGGLKGWLGAHSSEMQADGGVLERRHLP